MHRIGTHKELRLTCKTKSDDAMHAASLKLVRLIRRLYLLLNDKTT